MKKKSMLSHYVHLIVLSILISGVSMAYAGTETEPNNLLGLSTPVTIGGNFTGTLSPAGDVDFYQVSLATPGRLTCSITNPPANLRMYLHLYTRHAEYMWHRVAAINDGDDVFLNTDIIDPGTYFIKIEDSDRDTSDQFYTLDIAYIPVIDLQEPNNDPGKAFKLTGTSVSGTLFDTNDKDVFSIYALKDSVLNMTVTPPSEMTSYLELYNSNMDYMWVRDSADNAGDLLTLTHTVMEDGLYFLRVSDSRGKSMTEAYTLSVSGGSPGSQPVETSVTSENESNNEFKESNLIDVETIVSGAISPAGDNDWYKINIPYAGKLEIALENVPGNIQPVIRLFNYSKTQILSGQPTDPGTLVDLFYNITIPGSYYIQIHDLNSQAESLETYGISTTLTRVNDIYEPNNDYGDAKLLNGQNRINGFIFSNTDPDWYRVTVQQPGDLKIILNNLPGNMLPRIDLYTLSKSSIAGETGMAGTDLELVHPISEPGSYLIQIRDSSGNESIDPYTLTIFGAAFTSFAPVASIDRIDPGSIVVNDTIDFSGSGTDTDGSIAGYSWRSSIDGQLSDTAAFTTTSLSLGTHTVYFKVQDDDGIWSTEVSEVVYVGSSVSDETEPNASFAVADEIAIGRPVSAKIDAAGDTDFFKVYIPGPGHVTVSATNVPANLRLYLELYNRHYDYLWIRTAAASDGDDVILEFDSIEPGFYFLRITDTQNAFDAEFTYTLTLAHEPVVDPYENNNSLLDAHLLKTGTVEAFIFPASPADDDYYKVWVETGSTLNVSITQTPDNLRPYIELYDRNGSYMWVRNAAENEGDKIALSHLFDTSGYVYIRIHDYDGDHNWTQPYQMTITGAVFNYLPSDPPVTAENEINGEISLANLMAPGTPVSGTISPAGDLDWFRIDVPSPCIFHASLTNMAIRGRMRIYDNMGAQIAYREATNPGDDLLVDTQITRPGIYRIQLDGPGGGISDTPYSLNVSFTFAVDNYEPNDRFGDSANLNGSNNITAFIFKAGDRDWYRVMSEIGSTLKVVLADVPLEIRPRIDIFNLNYQSLASKTATNNGQDLTLSHAISETSDYFIRISDVGDDSFAATPYSLTITGALFNTYSPVAAIDSVLPNPGQAGTAITMTGHGEDVDGTITGFSWRSSIDGDIGASGSITASSLTIGVHDLYFKVMDNDGNWSRETKTRLYFGMPAPQETEPNNSVGAANLIEFETQYAGTIDPQYDGDFFKLPVPGPGILTISADNPEGSPMKTYLEIYDKNADYAWIRSSASNPGDPVTLEYHVGSSGDYFLKISDSASSTNSPYTFSVTFTPAPDPYEPNPDAWHSTDISPNEVIQANIFPQYDQDWYKVTVETPGTLSMSLTGMPSNLRGYIETYDQNIAYTWIRAGALNDGEEVFLSYDLPAAGTYWIKISDAASHSNASEPYTLTTAFSPAPDPFEPNHDFSHSTALETSPVEAYIFPRDDQDWYSFYASEGTGVVIKGDFIPPDVRLNFRLYNSNAEDLWIEAYSATAGDDVSLTYDIPSSGFYYLRVTGRDSTYAAGAAYRLSITGANLNDPPVALPAITESEPNNDFNVADRVGMDPVTGSLTASGDYDWYYLPVSGPGVFTVSLMVPPSVRSSIHIYNGNKGDVAHRDAENKGESSILSYNIPEKGNWYIRINDLDNALSDQVYTLDLDFTPVTDDFEPNNDYSQASFANFGETIRAMIFPASDQDCYQYEVIQEGILQLDIQQIPENIQIGIKVYDQNNLQKLNYTVKNTGDPLLTSLRIDNPGIYYVYIFANNGTFSPSEYALKVLLSPLEDATEPNDTFSDATILESQNRVSGLIFPANDEDWYSFMVDTPGILRVQVAEAEGFEPLLVLYTDSKNEIARMTAKNKGDCLLFERTIENPDRFYLRLYDSGVNDISVHPYVLTIEGGRFTQYSPMASIDRLSPNPSLQGGTVTLNGSGTDQDGTLQAYEWSSNRDGVLGYTDELSVNTLTSGDHRIGLRTQDNQGNWSAVVNQNLYITDQVQYESEYNNDIASSNPVPLNTWIKGTIQPKGDTDYYKIYLKDRGYVSALVDAVPGAMKPYIEFYNETLDYMWVRNSAINPQDWVLCSFYAEPGWYYAKISDTAAGSYTDTYGVKFAFTASSDPYEPNDLISKATPVVLDGIINDAIINRPGDTDFYKINISQSGRLNLSLTNVPEKMTGYIELYSPDLDYLWIRNSAINSGEAVFLSYDIAAPGTYYIKITDTSGNGHTQPYTFSHDFVPVQDAHEDNPDFGRSVLMPSDSVNAVIFPSGDQDWYKVYAQKDAVLSLSVTQVPDTMKPYIRIYNRHTEDMWVTSGANNNGDEIYLQYTASESSFYYIRITDIDSRSYLDPYTLTITGNSQPPADTPQTIEINPNGDSGDATLIQTAVNISGTIDPEDDYDWYRVYINSPGVLTISHTAIPAEVTSEMWVYNFNKTQIGYRVATNPGENNVLTMTVTLQGLYYIRVADDGDNHFSGDTYTLRVDHSPVVDVNEPNPNYGTATNLGQETVTGYLFDSVDEDWYRVYVRTPGMISLSLTNVPEDLRPRLRLYTAEKAETGSWVNTNPGVGGDDLVTFDVPEPGFYFIRVDNEPVNGEDKNYSASPYTLRISGADFSTAPLLSAIGDRTIDQGVAYGFAIFATDPDNEKDLVFSASQLPPGAQFDPVTRVFSWTPGPEQAGAFTGIRFQVSDTVATDSEAITITVNRINQPPVLSFIGNKIVRAETNLTFIITAADPDQGDTLEFSAENLPAGAVFTPETQTFNWTPAANQVGVHNTLLFKVTDGERTDFEYISVDVTLAATPPTVATGGITNVSQTGASVSGEVVSDGLAEITERGVVYATTAGPSVAGTKMTSAGQTGVFTANLTGLNTSTLYYVRAYAVNEKGVSYGEEKTLTTLDPILIPDIQADPLTHNFGGIEKDTVSMPVTVSVTNQGTAVLNIAAVTLSGTDATEFIKQSDTCSNQTLAPSGSRTIDIVFSPTSTGDKQAVLTLPSNDPDLPNLVIQLTGEGLDAPILKGDINGDGEVRLDDAVLALEISSAHAANTVRLESDVNDDQKIGVFEAIYDIQGLSTLRQLKSLTLTSPQFREDQVIPEKYTQDGDNISPPLTWTNPPAGTQSFVLVMDDPDAVPVAGKVWDHWIVYNIPASISALQENAGASGGENLPLGAAHGTTSFETENDYYQGPAPPDGSGPHTYVFTLYALSVADLNPIGTTKDQIEAAMEGKILSRVSLAGVYERKNAAVSEGTITLKSRAWNDNDGFLFNTGSVVIVGDCYPDCNMDFYVETNIVFLGNGVLAKDLGVGSSLANTSQVPLSGYDISDQDILDPQLGKAFAILLPDGTYGIIEFTQIALEDPINPEVTFCTVDYKYRSDGGTAF